VTDRLAATLAAVAALGQLDRAAMAEAQAKLDQLTKPPGSLGRLEDLVVRLAGITGRADAPLDRRRIVVLAGDHGVTARGVSAYPAAVTPMMVSNFVAGGAAINVLARQVGARVTVVDVGVAADIPATGRGRGGGRLIRARVANGTADLSVGPAMTELQTRRAIDVGLRTVERLTHRGLDVIGIGEMGIGNTTAAAALVAALTDESAELVTGRGTGVDDDAWERKVAVVAGAVERHRRTADAGPLATLADVGGLEIAGLVGVILGAVAARIPVMLDGYITGAAALVAEALAPGLAPRLLAGHRSVEPGHRIVLERLGLDPILDLELRLGEGTGAALAMGVLASAVAIRDRMATFASAGVPDRA
jgi:nicotinate-nucleotide--dimethylbenzimidazole phosphoribosyltransferase